VIVIGVGVGSMSIRRTVLERIGGHVPVDLTTPKTTQLW